MAPAKKKRACVALWLAIGVVVGACLPPACNRCMDYVGWLIGSNCWKALIQLEQLKSQSLMQPVDGRNRV